MHDGVHAGFFLAECLCGRCLFETEKKKTISKDRELPRMLIQEYANGRSETANIAGGGCHS